MPRQRKSAADTEQVPSSAPVTKTPKPQAKPGKARPNVEVFIAEYAKTQNGTQSAITAGYSPKSAHVTASQLLRNPNVKAQIANLRETALVQVQRETGITLERTLREIARIAFFDARRLFKADGTPIPIHELDDETASAIAGLDVSNERAKSYDSEGGSPESIQVRKYKLIDRKGPLDMLMKHLGGYKEDNGQAGTAAAKALASMAIRFVEPKGEAE